MFTGKADEDVDKWFIKFEYVANANGWDEERMVKKLPCLLDSHAFTAYYAANAEDKQDYRRLKEYLG